jgi:hypothetical protein
MPIMATARLDGVHAARVVVELLSLSGKPWVLASRVTNTRLHAVRSPPGSPRDWHVQVFVWRSRSPEAAPWLKCRRYLAHPLRLGIGSRPYGHAASNAIDPFPRFPRPRSCVPSKA